LQIKRVGNKSGSNVDMCEIIKNNRILFKTELVLKYESIIFLFSNSPISNNFKNLFEKCNICENILNSTNNYMKNKYGIPIKYILQNNPIEFNVILDNQEKKTLFYNLGLIGDIKINTYKFYKKEGLLNSVLFSQIINIIYQKSLFMIKQYNCTLHQNYSYSGKSIGEISALLICSNTFTINQSIDILFIIGSIFLNE